jgi:GNAT superfamily N-acetyltransferase
VAASRQGLKTRFFDRWDSALDDDLETLPESDICSHELFRILLQTPGPARKRTVRVTEQGKPIALVGLRQRDGYWDPVTRWLVPGMIFPLQEGALWRVLGAVGLTMDVGLWRWEQPPPPIPWIKDVKTTPTRGMACSEDFEAYWRQLGHFKNIRKVRNRCKEFEFRVNCQGMRDWTVWNWGERWCVSRMPEFYDRLIVAEYLEKKELLYTLSLHDHGRPVAGATILVHHGDAVAYVNYRDPEYDRHGVMTSLIERCFYWAKEKGLGNIDIGGSAEYKNQWAPMAGQKYEFRVCPHPVLYESWPFLYTRHLLDTIGQRLRS